MVIRIGNPDANQVALTFDDGPNPVYTPKILSILREAGVTATFFLIGRNAERWPDVVREIHAGGHNIGNHTYTHRRLAEASANVIENEIKRTSAVLADITGESPLFFRPPGGKLDNEHRVEDIVNALGLRTVVWNLECGDWYWPWETQYKNQFVIWRRARQIYTALSQKATPGSIIDLHDGTEQFDVKNSEKRAIPTYRALPRLLKTLQLKKGLHPVRLSEMELIEEPF